MSQHSVPQQLLTLLDTGSTQIVHSMSQTLLSTSLRHCQAADTPEQGCTKSRHDFSVQGERHPLLSKPKQGSTSLPGQAEGSKDRKVHAALPRPEPALPEHAAVSVLQC